MMVSSGTGILIGQYNGSGRQSESAHVGVASLLLGLIIGSSLSLAAYLSANSVMNAYGLEAQVAQYGYEYLVISGSFTVNVTIGIVLATILRSNGYSKAPMFINLFAGLLNIIGNYIAIFQPFGLPVYGVQGVAISTVFSQIVSTILLYYTVKYYHISLPVKEWKIIPKPLYQKIIKIGMMNAGEILSYNMMQLTVIFFVVKMGMASLLILR